MTTKARVLNALAWLRSLFCRWQGGHDFQVNDDWWEVGPVDVWCSKCGMRPK